MNSPPRVCIITEIPTPYRQPILESLIRRSDIECDVVFLALTQADRKWKMDVRLSDRMCVLPGIQWCISGHHTFHVNRGVSALLSSGKYDALVLGGYSQPALWKALRFAWRHKTPYILWTESHHKKVRSRWLKAFKECWLWKIYGRSSANLVAGSWAKDYVLSYGAPKEKVYFFPNSIDGPSYARQVDDARKQRKQIRAELGVEDGVLILFVGSLIERKGVDLLLQAWGAMNQRGLNVYLACIGDGPLMPQLQAKLLLPGFQQPSELLRWYAAADLFVLPSRDEPYGAVLCEAMAAGLPLVASSAVGASADCISNGGNGFVVEAGSGESLLSALKQLVKDSDLRQRMGKASRERALQWTYNEFEKSLVQAVKTALS